MAMCLGGPDCGRRPGHGARLKVVAQESDARQAGVADVVLDALDVPRHRLAIDAQRQEKAREYLVAKADPLGDAATALGEGEAPVSLVRQVTQLSQLLDHDTDARAAEPEFSGDVGDAGIALLDHEVLDALQVVLLTD